MTPSGVYATSNGVLLAKKRTARLLPTGPGFYPVMTTLLLRKSDHSFCARPAVVTDAVRMTEASGPSYSPHFGVDSSPAARCTTGAQTSMRELTSQLKMKFRNHKGVFCAADCVRQ